jgi:hypothetical protein
VQGRLRKGEGGGGGVERGAGTAVYCTLNADDAEFSDAGADSAFEKMAEAERQMEEMKKEAMDSELVRRKLHNVAQELKGNIWVFCAFDRCTLSISIW